jgi:predicted metal-dependent hydrolase
MIIINIDKLIRSRRKTISLVVAQDATLVVRAPLTTPKEYIQDLVFKKRFWIKKKQEILRERYKRNPPKEFVNGEAFLFLGNVYRLKIVDDGVDIELGDSLEIPKRLLPHAKHLLIGWYRKQAHTKIMECVEWYAKLAGLRYESIKITGAEKRLGSCSINGKLNFSWRLMMAPLGIIDYVVVHELVVGQFET